MAKTRNMPDTLKYVRIKATEVSQWWRGSSLPAKKRIVRPTFVVDAQNEKTLATAKRWAGGWQNDEGQYDIVELPNTPFECVELVTLERRGRGGRAWKVLIDGAYYVDMREETLLECLINGPGVTDGMIKGPFVWATAGQGLRITRVESNDHKAATKVEKLKKPAARLKKKDLVIGGVYATLAGTESTFLGYVDVDTVASNLKLSTSSNVQLWATPAWDELINPEDYRYRRVTYNVTWTKSRHVCELIKKFDVGDPLAKLKEIALKNMSDEQARLNLIPINNMYPHAYGYITSQDRAQQLARAAANAWPLATLRAPKQTRVIPDELKEFSEQHLKGQL